METQFGRVVNGIIAVVHDRTDETHDTYATMAVIANAAKVYAGLVKAFANAECFVRSDGLYTTKGEYHHAASSSCQHNQ